jgi:hypothetical protein
MFIRVPLFCRDALKKIGWLVQVDFLYTIYANLCKKTNCFPEFKKNESRLWFADLDEQAVRVDYSLVEVLQIVGESHNVVDCNLSLATGKAGLNRNGLSGD